MTTQIGDWAVFICRKFSASERKALGAGVVVHRSTLNDESRFNA